MNLGQYIVKGMLWTLDKILENMFMGNLFMNEKVIHGHKYFHFN